MNERDVRNQAKAWMIKNNNLIVTKLLDEGVMSIVEDAFMAGSEGGVDKERDDRIEELESEVDSLQCTIDDLEEENLKLEEAVDAMGEKLDLSVKSIK